MSPGTTTPWHAGPELLAAYVAGSLAALDAASVEQHLGHCADCRLEVRPLVDASVLQQSWLRVRDAVEEPRPPIPVRIARRLGLTDAHAVLLGATLSLRTAWLTSSFVALAFATFAAHLATGPALWPFLLVAPLIPMLGVAASYAPSDDPLEGLVVATPYGRGRLVLLRTMAVLATTLPLTFLVSLTLPGPVWVAAAWLGPALTLVPVLMAVASYLGPRTAAGLVAVGWAAVVLPSVRLFTPTWPVEPTQQLVLLTLAFLAVAVLALRARRTTRIGAVL
jgi:hypothetical protein